MEFEQRRKTNELELEQRRKTNELELEQKRKADELELEQRRKADSEAAAAKEREEQEAREARRVLLTKRYREASSDAEALELEPDLRKLYEGEYKSRSALTAFVRTLRYGPRKRSRRGPMPAHALPPVRVYRLGDANPPTRTYVGSVEGDNSIDARIRQHMENPDSIVSRKRLFVRLPLLTSCASGKPLRDEEEETIANMYALGINNAQGAQFITPNDRSAAFACVAHHYNLCRRCGDAGHKARECLGQPFSAYDRPFGP